MKLARKEPNLNCKEGMALKKGAWTPLGKATLPESPQRQDAQGIGHHTQTPFLKFLNPDPFQQWYGVKNVARVRVNGENCMALLDNGMQINTIIPSFIKTCSLEVGPCFRPSQWTSHLCGSGECIYPTFRLCGHMGSNGWIPGYDKDQIALVILDLSDFRV